MRVYGHRSKFQALAKKYLSRRNDDANSTSDDSFTSSEDEAESSSTTFDRTHETSPLVPKQIDQQHGNSATSLDPFDILDEIPIKSDVSKSRTKQRKVTRILKPVIYCNSELDITNQEPAGEANEYQHEFQTTIDSISSMISSLKDSNEVISSYSLIETAPKNSSGSGEQIRYGRTRTLRQSETDAQDEEVAETNNVKVNTKKQKTITSSSNLRDDGDDNAVIHVNQLKALGEGLKYEDELDFLRIEAKDEGRFVATLINCCLQLMNNEELVLYVSKYKADELWDWFLQNSSLENTVMCFLQSWIAHRVPLSRNSPQWQTVSEFARVCVSLQSVPELTKGSKITKLNFRDLTRRIESSPKDIALALWEQNITPNSNDFITLIELLVEPSSQLLGVLEKYLNENITEEVMVLMHSQIMNLVTDFIENINLIKILIKLTNHIFFLNLLSMKERVLIIENCLSYMIQAYNAGTLSKQSFTDTLILQLGVVLNIVAHSKVELCPSIAKEVWVIIENWGDGDKFLLQLLALVFVLYVRHNYSDWTETKKESINKNLQDLSQNIQNTNKTIYNNVQVAFDILSNI